MVYLLLFCGVMQRCPWQRLPTFWPLDAGVLVVTQEEALSATALIAAHHVDADLLASTVPL